MTAERWAEGLRVPDEALDVEDGGTRCRALLAAAEALQPVIRGFQGAIEREGRLPPPLVEQLQRAGLYRMIVPRQLGGVGADPLTCLRALELAAEGDGAVAWNLATNAAGMLTALTLPDEGIRDVFGDGESLILGGSIAPRGGKARAVPGGYVVSGRWRFGSGCREATWLGGSGQVFEDGRDRVDAGDAPEVRRFFFPASECTVLETWKVSGMRGTGSHDWSVTDVFVPEHRTQLFRARPNRWPGTLYALPWGSFAGLHFSAVATGIARAAVDALMELAGAKVPTASRSLLRDNPQVQEWVGRADALVGAARAYRAAIVTEVCDAVAAGRRVTPEQEARWRVAACYTTDNALEAARLAYRAGGTTSIEEDHPLARCWRDLQVVGQAIGLLPELYVFGGATLLGVDVPTRQMR